MPEEKRLSATTHNSSKSADLVTLNLQLAQQIEQAGTVPLPTLQKVLAECNQAKLHLGQTLIKERLLQPADLAKLMRSLSESTVASNEATQSRSGQTHELRGLGGSHFGKYEILGEIARGGMGIVYRVRQAGSDRIEALKVLLTGAMADSTQIRRFLREAKATAQLNHPHIIPIYEMGEENGYHYFTMKYVDGGTFDKVIGQAEVPLSYKIEILIKICEALYQAHQQKILHRDIKPSNVLMSKDGEPFLSDFGLAKFVDSNSKFTQTGSAIGTPFYMSPEQVKADKNTIGVRSDIYSLGIMLYQILTGKLPFVSDMLTDLYRKICDEEPAAPKSHNPGIPNALAAICLKAIEKRPEHRYATALEMAEDLRRFMAGQKTVAQRFHLRNFVMRYVRGHRRFLVKIFIALIVATVISISVYGGSYWVKRREIVRLKATAELSDRLRQAQQCLADGKPQQALLILKRLGNNANSYEIPLELGKIYQRLKQTKEARVAFETAARLAPNEPELLYHKSLFHDQCHEYETALRLIDAYCPQKPETVEGYQLRASLLQQLGRKDAAAQDRQKIAELLDNELKAVPDFLAQGQTQMAMVKLNQLLGKYPKYARGLVVRAQTYHDLGELQRALNDVSQALELEPVPAHSLLKAQWLYEGGYLAESYRDLVALVALTKEIEAKLKIYRLLADIAFKLEKYRTSYDYYAEIAKYQMPQGELALLLGRAAFYCSEHDQATQYLQTAVGDVKTVGSGKGEAFYLLGCIQDQHGDKQQAMVSWQAALTANAPQSPQLHWLLGERYANARQFQTAVTHLEQATGTLSFKSQVYVLLAKCYVEIGRHELAISNWSKALELEPWQSSYYFQRGLIYTQLRQFPRAEQDFVASLALNREYVEPVLKILENIFEDGLAANYSKMSLLFRNFRHHSFATAVPDLFEAEIKKLTQECIENFLSAPPKLPAGKWDPKQAELLLAGLKESDSAAIHEMAYSGLLAMYQEPALQQMIATTLANPGYSTDIRQRIKKLSDEIYAKRLDQARGLLRFCLVRFYGVADQEALSQIYQQGQLATDGLNRLLSDPSENIILRFMAANGLWDLRLPSSYEQLQHNCKADDLLVRLFSCVFLAKQDDDRRRAIFTAALQLAEPYARAVVAKFVPLDMPSIVERLKQDHSIEVRLYIADRVRKAKDRSADQLLIAGFSDKSALVRTYAILAYWDFPELRAKLSMEDFEVRRKILRKSYANNIHTLVKATEDPDVRVRRAAVVQLAAIGEIEEVRLLKKHLTETDDLLRFQTIMTIAGRQQIDLVVSILLDPKERLLFRSAVLVGAGDKTSSSAEIVGTAFAKLIADADYRIRIIIISLLAKMGKKGYEAFGSRILIQRIKSPDYAVRLGCLVGLIRAGHVAGWAAIPQMLQDSDERVRALAATAATYLTTRNNLPQREEIHRMLQKSSATMKESGAIGYMQLIEDKMPYTGKIANDNEAVWDSQELYERMVENWYGKLKNLAAGTPPEEDYPLAVDDYLTCVDYALDLDSSKAKYWLERGIIYYVKGNYQKSIQDIEKAVQLQDDFPLFWLWLAQVYAANRQYQQALAITKKLLVKQPFQHRLCVLHSELLKSLGDSEHAALEAERATWLEKRQ